jgi:hypothetical protein
MDAGILPLCCLDGGLQPRAHKSSHALPQNTRRAIHIACARSFRIELK